MKTKKYLKKNKIDFKYALSAMTGILVGTWIISQVQYFTGFHNTYFALFFGILYAYIIFKKLDIYFHSLNRGAKIGDKTNL